MRASRDVTPYFTVRLDESGPYPITLGPNPAGSIDFPPVRLTAREAAALGNALLTYAGVCGS